MLFIVSEPISLVHNKAWERERERERETAKKKRKNMASKNRQDWNSSSAVALIRYKSKAIFIRAHRHRPTQRCNIIQRHHCSCLSLITQTFSAQHSITDEYNKTEHRLGRCVYLLCAISATKTGNYA